MPNPILESMERGIVDDLLEIFSIHELYVASKNGWITYYKQTSEATRDLGKSLNGNEGPFSTARELIRLTTPIVASLAGQLLAEIRKLKQSEKFERSDLYQRLADIEVRRIVLADQKGLFLLFANAIEKYESSTSGGQDGG